MKVSLYILKNNKNNYYIGITKLEPELRLQRHNKGDVESTKYKRPWKLLYCESFINFQQARIRERQIKSWHGGNAFKRFLAKAAESSNGRTHASGTWHPGSNPGSAALAGN